MFSSNELKKIASMPDNELKEKISLIINAAGGNNSSLDISSADVTKIKKMISELTEKDVKKIMEDIPEEKINEIKSKIDFNSK